MNTEHPTGPPMTLGNMRREKGGSKRKSLGSAGYLLGEPPGACGRRRGSFRGREAFH